MKQQNENSLKVLFDLIIKENKLKPKLHEAKLKDMWPDIMGTLINKYTADISIRKNTLYLRITSAPLKNEFVMSKAKFIDLINQKLGEEFIKDIVIR